jgi:hypothetical protein
MTDLHTGNVETDSRVSGVLDRGDCIVSAHLFVGGISNLAGPTIVADTLTCTGPCITTSLVSNSQCTVGGNIDCAGTITGKVPLVISDAALTLTAEQSGATVLLSGPSHLTTLPDAPPTGTVFEFITTSDSFYNISRNFSGIDTLYFSDDTGTYKSNRNTLATTTTVPGANVSLIYDRASHIWWGRRKCFKFA